MLFNTRVIIFTTPYKGHMLFNTRVIIFTTPYKGHMLFHTRVIIFTTPLQYKKTNSSIIQVACTFALHCVYYNVFPGRLLKTTKQTSAE